MKAVRVAADRWNFELADGSGYVTPLGGNILDDRHPVQETLFDHFDARDCEKRFVMMAELGLNCLRQAIGCNRVFDPRCGLLTDGLKNWDTFIRLAEKYGVYLMPVGGYIGGNDWFDAARLADSGKALEESCAFWQAFTGHFAGHPAIWAWDLRNELLYDNKEQFLVQGGESNTQRLDATLKDRWPWWLETRYGSVAAMNKSYGSSFDSFKEVLGSVPFVEQPFDLRHYDFRRYLNERGYDWCKRQCDTIRSAAPGHMIVSGNNTWLSPDQDLWLANGFHNHALHDLFDFITHHPYPALQCLPGNRGDPLDGGEPLRYWLSACIGMSRLEHFGKPVVIQEFGWYGGGPSKFLCDLPHRSEREHADYTRTLTDTLIPHANGFINWPLCDMPAANDISNHGGIFTHDGRPKELAAVYRALVERLNGKRQTRARDTVTLTYSLLGLYTCRGYQDAMWDRVHEVISAGEVPDFRFI